VNLSNIPNPFYILLMVVGAIFAATACAYGAMSTYYARALQEMPLEDAARIVEQREGWMALLDEHGMTIMFWQLVALGVCTVAAITTDGIWKNDSSPNVADIPQKKSNHES